MQAVLTRFVRTSVLGSATLLLLTLAACVTINVYFPEAEAERIADEFIEGVIGDTEPAPIEEAGDGPQAAGFHWSQLLISAAYAQTVNIDINTPSIRSIQGRMNQRFNAELSRFFDSGAIGFNRQAMIEIRDLSAVSLRDRNSLKAAVAADNKDRDAVYREIAVANGHPEWEGQIRQTFADRWVANAKSGWYYQGATGWQQK